MVLLLDFHNASSLFFRGGVFASIASMVLSWDVHDAATGLGFHGAFVGRSWCCGTFPVLPLGASMVVCALPFHLWDIHVVSIGLPYTVFPRYTRGSSVVRPWCSHGTVMALPCNFQGSSMVLRS